MHELFDLLMAGGGQLTTVTFNANANWTAPAGVSRVENVQGKGGSGNAAVPAQYASETVIAASMNVVSPTVATLPNAGPLAWANFNAQGVAVRDIFLASVSSEPATFTQYLGSVYSTSGGSVTHREQYAENQSAEHGFVKNNTVVLRTVGGGPSGSNVDTNSGSYSAYQYVDFDYLVSGTGTPATTGASSTALGKTFAGGTGGAAATTDQGSATVVPGNVYPIVVAPGGFVTLTYYA